MSDRSVMPDVNLTAQSLPRIAYRGLWDKFAAPGTSGALRRSYLRGVPSLVRPSGDLPLEDAMALVSDRTVNRFHQPIYFVVPRLPLIHESEGIATAVFVVVSGGPQNQPWPMWRWSGDEWISAGCYVPLGAALDLSSFRQATPGHVLFESTNVLTDFAERAAASAFDDDATLASIRKTWESGSGSIAFGSLDIARVTDLVEVEQLDQRIREAA